MQPQCSRAPCRETRTLAARGKRTCVIKEPLLPPKRSPEPPPHVPRHDEFHIACVGEEGSVPLVGPGDEFADPGDVDDVALVEPEEPAGLEPRLRLHERAISPVAARVRVDGDRL